MPKLKLGRNLNRDPIVNYIEEFRIKVNAEPTLVAYIHHGFLQTPTFI
jgi:hypothetical protein